MNRTFSLCAVSLLLLLSGCVIRQEIRPVDPAKIPATQADINTLRKDIGESFQLMYNALVQQIRAATPQPKKKVNAKK